MSAWRLPLPPRRLSPSLRRRAARNPPLLSPPPIAQLPCFGSSEKMTSVRSTLSGSEREIIVHQHAKHATPCTWFAGRLVLLFIFSLPGATVAICTSHGSFTAHARVRLAAACLVFRNRLFLAMASAWRHDHPIFDGYLVDFSQLLHADSRKDRIHARFIFLVPPKHFQSPLNNFRLPAVG